MNKICLLLLVSSNLLGCASQRHFTTIEPEGAIYRAIADAAYKNRPSGVILVEDSTAIYTPMDSSWGFFYTRYKDSIPQELVSKLAARSHARYGANKLPLPKSAKIVNRKESAAAQKRGLGGTGVFRFSAIVFSSDSTQAFTYYDVLCWDICGEGAAVLLERKPNGKWVIKKRVPYWFS